MIINNAISLRTQTIMIKFKLTNMYPNQILLSSIVRSEKQMIEENSEERNRLEYLISDDRK